MRHLRWFHGFVLSLAIGCGPDASDFSPPEPEWLCVCQGHPPGDGLYVCALTGEEEAIEVASTVECETEWTCIPFDGPGWECE